MAIVQRLGRYHRTAQSGLTFLVPMVDRMLPKTDLREQVIANVIGSLTLDKTLTSRNEINGKLRTILDEVTDKWGIKVTRVELKEITPPRDIQQAMEKRMPAERARRAAILTAEGDKRAAILKYEGEKESAILRAAGERQAAVLRAEG